jgi:hypothetical protein
MGEVEYSRPVHAWCRLPPLSSWSQQPSWPYTTKGDQRHVSNIRMLLMAAGRVAAMTARLMTAYYYCLLSGVFSSPLTG